MNQTLTLISLIFFALAVTISSCKKEEKIVDRITPDTPFNPYDTINYNGIVIDEIKVDTHTFAGLHKYVLQTKCANPACHDGTFEPDFRTIQSSYNTLVFHPVLKNTTDNFFTHRVVPGDTTHSWLWERVITDDAVLGKMPLYDTLDTWQLNAIRDWILGGAKDLFGNSNTQPGYKPGTFGLVAYLTDVNNMRVDTIRFNDILIYPFVVPQNTNLRVWIGLFEQNLAGDFEPGVSLEYNRLKYSVNQPNNFTSSTEINLTKQFSPFWAPSLVGVDLPYFHFFDINTSQFNTGDIVYFRSYVRKPGESLINEIPGQDGQPFLFTYFSFIVQ